MRLRDDLDAGQVGPGTEPLDQLGQRQHAGRDLGGTRVVDQLDGVGAQGGQARRLEAEDRRATLDVRRERGDRPFDDRPRAVS